MSLLFIRADGNSTIGSGHVMRCLAVAQAAREQGAQCIFVGADEAMRFRIEQAGFALLCLDSDYRDMEAELPALEKLLEKYRPDSLLLDSYFVTAAYMRVLQAHTRLIYMDDVNAFIYPADMLVNYNLFSSAFQYDTLYSGTATRLLLGCRYTPLRKEFQNLPARRPPQKVKDILVSTGGADPLQAGGTLLRYALEKKDYEWHFIVGGLNTQYDRLHEKTAGKPHIHLHTQVTEIAKLMCGCDLAISAAGSTLYELCAAGTPAFCYAFADNQVPGAEVFAKEGLMVSLGDYRDGTVPFLQKLDTSLTEITQAAKKWGHISAKMQTVVDGQGAARLAEKILTAE